MKIKDPGDGFRLGRTKNVINANVKDLTPHAQNANKGSERGDFQLEHSLKKLGIGRGIVVDKNGVIIAGNHVAAKAAELGLENAIVVETTGDTLVITKRTDLDLASDTDKRAVELAIADNRVSEINYDPDLEIIKAEIEAGADLEAFYKDDELEEPEEKPTKPEKTFKVTIELDGEEFVKYREITNRLMQNMKLENPSKAVMFALEGSE